MHISVRGRFFAAFFGLGWSFPALAAEIPAEWLRPQAEISDAWKVRKEVLSLERDLIDRKDLDKIAETQRRFQLQSIPAVSMALLREIQDRPDDPDSVQADRLEYAEKFWPDWPAVHFAHCTRMVRTTGWVDAVSECWTGIRMDLGTDAGRLRWLTNGVLILLLGLFASSAVFFGFLILRYRVPVTHHWAHWLKGLSPRGVCGVVFAVLAVSWLLIGWPGPALVLVALLWRYLSLSERVVCTLLLILFCAVPFGFYAPALHFRYLRGIVPVLENPLNGSAVAANAVRLREWTRENPKDADALFALGLIEKRIGRLPEARRLFDEAARVRPGWAKPAVNLATLDYLEGNFSQAISRLAAAAGPQTMPAYLNLSRIYYKLSRLDEGVQASRKAKEIDSSRFALLEKAGNQADPRQFLIDETLDGRELTGRIWDFTPEIETMRNRFHRTYFRVLPLPVFWVVIVCVFIYALLSTRLWRVRRTPRSCEKCGLASCALCEPVLVHESLCSQCYHIFVRLETIDPDERKKKDASIRRHRMLREFRERWVGLVAPPFAFFFRGDAGFGIALTMLTVPLMFLIHPPAVFLRPPWFLASVPLFPTSVLAAAALGIIWAASLFLTIRR